MLNVRPTERHARRLIDSSLVWDNHACMPLRPADSRFLPQLSRLRGSGVDVVSVNVGFGPLPFDLHIRMIASLRHWLAQRPEAYVLARSVADIDRARLENKLAVFFDIEGMAILDEGDHGVVAMLRELGVGWMLVAYNRNNAAGGGCYDEDPGLSVHGQAVVAEMKRVGMIVCCSHTGHRTARDILERAEMPVIFSHSNAAGVHGHARNLPDDLILKCAATRGVIGVNGIGVFLGDNDDRPETVARHIDHIAQRVGAAHVGLALDYVFDQEELVVALETMRETFPDDETLKQPPKMVPPEAVEAIVEALVRRGYHDVDLVGILGGNWRRVANEVWRQN